MSLKGRCIKAIKSHKTSYKDLPKRLRDEIEYSKPCCLSRNVWRILYDAMKYGHPDCFIEAAETLSPDELKDWLDRVQQPGPGPKIADCSNDEDHLAILKYIHSRIGLLPRLFRMDASAMQFDKSSKYALEHGMPSAWDHMFDDD